MPRQKDALLLFIMFGILVFSSGCGTTRSHYVYDSSFQVNTPQTARNCYDAAALLGVNISKAREITKKALQVNMPQVREKTETHLCAWTPLQSFGGGGDEINVKLEKVDDTHTFVTVTTLSLAGIYAKAWSCEIINEIVLRAEE